MALDIKIRKYGKSGRQVVLLHGGPAVAGYMKRVAELFSDNCQIIEPFQRTCYSEKLTVKVHIEDLKIIIEENCSESKPVIVGHSWGAMLALAFAADYPDMAESLLIVSCGTFDKKSREKLIRTINDRKTPAIKKQLDQLHSSDINPDERLFMLGKILEPLYSYKLTSELEIENCSAKAYSETWEDIILKQKKGVYPRKFSAIKIPVLMFHGDVDPHPGNMIKDSLLPYLPQLKYVELHNCGHYPWLEKEASGVFKTVVLDWLRGAYNK